MTKKTDSKQTQEQSTIAELTEQNEQLVAELALKSEERRELLAALDAQNIRLNSLERALAIASGVVNVPPLTVKIRDDATASR